MAVEERIKAQKAAARLMAGGKFLDALPVLKNALAAYGPHISIVMDIPACYYMIGDYIQFERYTERAAKEFESVAPYLSSESYVRSALTLGRLQEELGQFTKALELYEKASQFEDQGLALVFNVYAQRLRLKAFLGIRKDFEKDYRVCEKALLSNQGVFALTHALILADLFLGDTASAGFRLRTVLPIANPVEKRLVLFDYMAEVLLQTSVQSLSHASEFRSFSDYFVVSECDAFEQSVWMLLDGTCDLTRTAEMSLIGSLKFTYLAQKFANDVVAKTSAATKWVLLLHGLSADNRSYLEARCPVDLAEKMLTMSEAGLQVQLDFVHRSVSYDPSSFVVKLLSLFMHSGDVELSAEFVCEKIYAEPLKQETADRLRRAVSRANSDLAKKLGLDTAFLLRKNLLRCAVNVQPLKPSLTPKV